MVRIDAPFHLARAAVSHMRRAGYGRIVLTTSGRAMRVEGCVPGLVAYSAAKMAQVGLMVGLAAELGNAGICVNAISPVAATRVLRRSAPELLPELVALGAAFLASSACTVSGVVLQAVGGRFFASRWDRSEGSDLGPTRPCRKTLQHGGNRLRACPDAWEPAAQPVLVSSGRQHPYRLVYSTDPAEEIGCERHLK